MMRPKTAVWGKLQHWAIGLLVLLTVIFLAAALAKPGDRLTFDNESVSDFGNGWNLLGENGRLVPMPALTLPVKLDVNGPVRLGKTLPREMAYPTVLCFRSAQQQVRLYCDQQLIYSFGYEDTPRFGRSPGSAWNIIRLPQDCAGKNLMLELDSPYAAYRGRVDTVLVGSKASLLFWLLRHHVLSIVLTLVIFAAGIVTLLAYFQVIRKDAAVEKETLHLGLFAIFISLWLFGECRLTQFFGIPPAVNLYVTFSAMLATPIPLVRYVACGCSCAGQKILNVATWLLGVLFASCVLLQAFGILDFIQQLVLIHTCFALVCVATLYTIVTDAIRQPDARQFRLLASMGVLALAFCVETAMLYFGSRSVGAVMRIGVLVFIAMQAQAAFQNANQMMRLSRLASVDAMTGCLNRTAYSQCLQDWEGQRDIGVVIADINDLKYINDTFGHDVGDEAIVRCSKNFSEVFSPYGRCFRIGGDEFAMLGKHLTAERLTGLAALFASRNAALGGRTTYPFIVSCGCTIYDPQGDQSLSDAVRRADKSMYHSKRQSKEPLEPSRPNKPFVL